MTLKLGMRVFIVIYFFLTIIILTVYSYSQIDLNLTLSSFDFYQELQNILIQLGYFNRFLSTSIYVIILLSLFLVYYFFLLMVERRIIGERQIKRIILTSSFILFFSYSAFSHDLFNYMFDARIVTKYGLNPYYFKALDFPDDLWTRFMHWTHRTYPYGPLWLIITLPFSYLGFGKFTLTLALFKFLFIFAYLTNSYLIYLIANKINHRHSLYALSFFAFNPLILIESLLSPHNDSLMLLFALLSIYLFINKKYFNSIWIMLVSAGIKFVTLPLLLVHAAYFFIKKKFLTAFPFIYLISIIPVIYLRELLPWYAIPLIGLSAIVIDNKFLRIFNFIFSFVLLLKYVSYLYTGEWTKSSYIFFLDLVFIAAIFSFTCYLFRKRIVI